MRTCFEALTVLLLRGKNFCNGACTALLALTLIGPLEADEFAIHTSALSVKNQPLPWFTGPLLTPSGHVIPEGHWDLEPYEFITTDYGSYDNHWKTHSLDYNFYHASTQIFFWYGFAKRFDFSIRPVFSWNHTSGASHWVLNDIRLSLEYQLLYDKIGTWWPAIKLSLPFTFPLGKYRNLEPQAKGTDIGGTGSWNPGITVSMSHLYWWGGHIFFAPRFSFNYTFPTPAHVRRYSIYGGGRSTNGTVFPGQSFTGLFGFELSLSQRWALAGDIQYFHANKSRFSGHRGKTKGVPNAIGFPSVDQWSISPAIEYNWNAYVGMIAGVWFTIAARNSPEFASTVIAVNVYR